MEDLEKYNQTGMRDAYNVLKYLESKKGGNSMNDPKDEKNKPIHPEDDINIDEYPENEDEDEDSEENT